MKVLYTEIARMAKNGGNEPSHEARCIAGIIGAVILGAMTGIGVSTVIAPDFIIELGVIGAAAYALLTAAALC